MDDTARMIALLRRLKVEMNGAVVEAMQQRGIEYPLSYGVSIPTIQEIARECPAGHSLALLLFRQQVRELMIAAIYVDRPEWVTRTQMEEWGKSLTNAEIAEQVASGLFFGASEALSVAMEWLSSDQVWLNYAALLMAAKRLMNPREDDRAQGEALVKATDACLRSRAAENRLSSYMVRAGVTLLRRCAMLSADCRDKVVSLNSAYASASERALNDLSEELTRQLEYTPLGDNKKA